MPVNDYKGVLVFAEQKDGNIHKVSYELLGKGKELAEVLNVPVYSVILGPSNIDVSELIYRGSDKVYYVEDDEIFDKPDELVYVKNLVNLISDIKPEICLFGATAFGRSVAPRVAAAMRAGLTADCTNLKIDEEDGKLIQIRPAFSENILAHIKSDILPQMSTVRYKEFPEAKRDEQKKGEIIKIKSVNLQEQLVEIVGEGEQQDVDIAEAEVVISAGSGLKSSEDLKMLRELAGLLGGVVGASRPLVDEGYISKAHQVGYSGNRVKPKLYISCGISGAPQHLAGMKESGVILAINNDPSAPIFNVADYGIVGDLYEVIPQLIEKIKSKEVKIF